MESSFQKIIAAIVGVMIMFIIPVYIAFEKVDDISYSLVLKFTQSFVDNVREKGYISPEMYSDFMGNIHSTSNSYDVEIEHVKKRYDPAIYIYDKNGDILHILDYDKYIDDYNAGKDSGNIKLEVDEGVYTDKNTEIKVEDPSIVIKNPDKLDYVDNIETEAAQEQFYRDYIQEYRRLNNERIILDNGEIYADKEKLLSLGKEFDEEIYIDSNITLTPGLMTILNTKYEPANLMKYDDYINSYDSKYSLEIAGNTYEVFNGPKFYSKDIINTKAAMWIDDGRSYNELSKKEKENAEKMYYERIDDYKSTGKQAIIDSKGEIYSYSTSPNYEPLTDYLATNIKINGSININNPSQWRVNNIEFNDYNIYALRKGNEVVADNGGVFKEENIKVVEGSVTKRNTGKKLDYTDSFIKDMLNSSNKITIERAEVYTNENIILSDDARVIVKHISGYTDPEDINPYVENKPIYTEDVNMWIDNLDEYILLKNEFGHYDSVTIDEITYNSDDGYEIQVIKPSRLYCFGQAISDIELTDNIDEYINKYEINGEIVFSREYYKSELNVVYGELKLYDPNGNLKYTFKEEENPDEYKKYKLQLQETGTVKVDKLSYSSEELTINYDNIIIEYKDENNQSKKLIIYSSENNFESYIDGYYDNQRIIRKKSEIYKNVKIIDPKIEIYSSDKTMLYKYQRESDNPEEVALWKKYSEEADKGSVTIVYKTSDVDVDRALLTISAISGGTTEIADNDDTDKNGVFEYFGYKTEFENEGTVTFAGSKVLSSDEIEITHPHVTIYNKETGAIIKEYAVDFNAENILGSFDERREEYELNHVIIDNPITYENNKNCLITIGHTVNDERITDKQIVNKLFSGTDITKEQFLADCLAGNVNLYNALAYIDDNSYTMNEGDEITVTVKNRNKTIASTFYSLFTASVGLDDVAKIYVNYGGNIKNDGATLLNDESGSMYNEEGRLFKYKGVAEEITLIEGKYSIECWGASGGGYDDASGKYTGGLGAYTKFDLEIPDDSEQTLYIYVGGAGSEYSDENVNNGGWNGGGNSYQGYGGGGATDIRLLRGETATDATSEASLLTRIAVAAGGGGSSKENGKGGYAGNNVSAQDGSTNATVTVDRPVGKGANANAIVTKNGFVDEFGNLDDVETAYEHGILGIGGKADFLGAGAGGAGLIGGSAAHNQYAGGGGGLSYVYSNRLLNNSTYQEIWNYYQESFQNNINLVNLRTTDYYGNFIWDNIYISNIEIKRGNDNSIPKVLEYINETRVGNGYVRIKKLS